MNVVEKVVIVLAFAISVLFMLIVLTSLVHESLKTSGRILGLRLQASRTPGTRPESIRDRSNRRPSEFVKVL